MNTRTTWFLALTAVLLGGYLWFTGSRAGTRVSGNAGASAVFVPIQPDEVTSLEIVRSNSVVRVQRGDAGWVLERPVNYAAQPTSIESLLTALSRLTPVDFIPGKQVATQPGGLGAFGLDQPIKLTVKTRSGRTSILRFGAMTPLEHRFYLQTVGTDGVFVADSAILAALPATVDEWRDRSLFDVRRTPYDRVELQQRGKTVFEAVQDPATQTWRLTKPLSARASAEALEALVNQLQTVRVTSFVNDGALVNPEAYGLQPAEAEFIVGRGTNDLVRLQFGASPTNAADQVFVQRALQTNLVLVPTNAAYLVRLPLDTFRDRRLMPELAGVSSLDFRGTERFSVRREGTNWFVVEPKRFPASRAAVEETFQTLESIGIEEFSADVVDSPQRFGLDQPVREYALGVTTNLGGITTNAPLVSLQFGGVPTNNVHFIFARRGDEPSVYSVVRSVLPRLPESPNQLRDWRFDTSNLVRVSIVRSNVVRELSRSANGVWTVTQGAPANLIPDALDETAFRLGNFNPYRYAVSDEKALLNAGGYLQVAHEVTLHFREGSGPLRRWRLRFGREVARDVPALAYFDDDPQPLQLRFPADIYHNVARDFGAP